MKKPHFTREELTRLAVVLVLAAAVCVILLLAPPGGSHAKWLPKCYFHELTGLHCPGCGATRAISALLRGDIAASLHNNLLLIPAILCGCLIFVKRNRKFALKTGYAVLIAVVAFTILRNIPCMPFTLLAPVPAP